MQYTKRTYEVTIAFGDGEPLTFDQSEAPYAESQIRSKDTFHGSKTSVDYYIPWHAITKAEFTYGTETADKSDAYGCDGGEPEKTCSVVFDNFMVTYAADDKRFYASCQEPVDYFPQIGDVIKVTLLDETKEYTLEYTRPTNSDGDIAYSNVDIEHMVFPPEDPNDYVLVLINGHTNGQRTFNINYFHDFGLEDIAQRPITIEACR